MSVAIIFCDKFTGVWLYFCHLDIIVFNKQINHLSPMLNWYRVHNQGPAQVNSAPNNQILPSFILTQMQKQSKSE